MSPKKNEIPFEKKREKPPSTVNSCYQSPRGEWLPGSGLDTAKSWRHASSNLQNFIKISTRNIRSILWHI